MILELENIHKSYKITESHSQSVLKDVSFSLKKGDRATIVGPSGSGKSTLLNMIGLLDVPDSGTIKINGDITSGLSDDQRADIRNKRLGFIFQNHQLLPQLTVIENILLPTLPLDKNAKKRAKARALELLDQVGLSEHINKQPGQLSGGECQRVAVLRALINEPDIVIADEPTGSLDDNNAREIGKLLVSLNETQKCTLIVVTHSLDLAQLTGNVYHLKEGKIKKS
jgi:lipoprotein-releasing system ATP-binding protein